jgi:hypothetical protein
MTFKGLKQHVGNAYQSDQLNQISHHCLYNQGSAVADLREPVREYEKNIKGKTKSGTTPYPRGCNQKTTYLQRGHIPGIPSALCQGYTSRRTARGPWTWGPDSAALAMRTCWPGSEWSLSQPLLLPPACRVSAGTSHARHRYKCQCLIPQRGSGALCWCAQGRRGICASLEGFKRSARTQVAKLYGLIMT